MAPCSRALGGAWSELAGKMEAKIAAHTNKCPKFQRQPAGHHAPSNHEPMAVRNMSFNLSPRWRNPFDRLPRSKNRFG